LTAADASGHEVFAASDALTSASVGGFELLLCHQCVVESFDPFVAGFHLAEVGAVPEDREHGGLIDADPTRDLSLGEPFGSEAEDGADGVGVVVRDEHAVVELVAGRWLVGPTSLARGLEHAESDVFGELLAVELSERPEDVVDPRHPHGATRGAGALFSSAPRFKAEHMCPFGSLDARRRREDKLSSA
jgi:hypothetical protein